MKTLIKAQTVVFLTFLQQVFIVLFKKSSKKHLFMIFKLKLSSLMPSNADYFRHNG
jgi:hypothetical protein